MILGQRKLRLVLMVLLLLLLLVLLLFVDVASRVWGLPVIHIA